MSRGLVLLSCALTLVLSGAIPAEANHTRKGRPKCSKVVKRTAPKGPKRTCRKPAKKAPAKRKTPVKRPAATPPAPARPTLLTPAGLLGAPVPAPAAPAPDAAPAAPTQTAPAAPVCGSSPNLGVRAEDAGGVFRFVVTRICVPAGRVHVELYNRDLQPHNLYAEGVEPAASRRQVVADVDGGGALGNGQVDLAPGRWRLLCAIEGHETMTATITASPAT